MEEIKIQLRDGIKVVIEKEKAEEIVLEKLGLKTITKPTDKVVSEPTKKVISSTSKRREKLLAFLRKNKTITSKQLDSLVKRCGTSYKIMNDLERKGIVERSFVRGSSIWTYKEEFDDRSFEELKQRFVLIAKK